MHVRTILNQVCRYKGFVYLNARLEESAGRRQLVVPIRSRKNSKGICATCGKPAPTYDHLPERRFEFVPMWGMAVFFVYARRRVSCPKCGVGAEALPWADGKQHLTRPFQAFLASWAEDLPWKRVAERFHTSWQTVLAAVERVVAYGLAHRRLDNVRAIGIDEIQYRKGHRYLTVVYQLDAGWRRLLWVGEERTIEGFRGFFATMTAAVPDFRQRVEFVCSDLWQAYLRVVQEELPEALHVLDRFHIRKAFSDALDKTRRQEAARLRKEGKEPVLAKSRWCFLKKRRNLTGKQRSRLADLLAMNLRTVKAYLLAEQFEHLWTYRSVAWARKFLAEWTRQAMYSKIEPLKHVARMLRRHRELILNYFRARKEINNGISEGLNLNLKLAMRKARGFRSFRVAEIAFYHQLGKLPKPSFDHEFW
jgi:transposase